MVSRAPMPLPGARLIKSQRWLEVQGEIFRAIEAGQYKLAKSMLDRFINQHFDKEKNNGEDQQH